MQNKTLNGYQIQKLLGSGGMAEVYYAENTLGQPVAIKVIRKEYMHIDAVVDRLKEEAKIMVKLNHPNIRKVLNIGEIDGRLCLIMEYLEGQTLSEQIRGGKLTDKELQVYFEQCKAALQYTHSNEVIHRDIKPSNIFITQNGKIKLMDFGIAKSEEGNRHTLTGQTLGTIIYMSPEQVKNPKSVTHKTDIYSLGVSFYHALTGKAPYDKSTDSDFNIQFKIVSEPLDTDLLPTHWKGVIEGCLEKEVSSRRWSLVPQSKDSISSKKINPSKDNHQEEATIIERKTQPEPQPQPSPKPEPEKKADEKKKNSFLPWLIGGLAVIALVVGITQLGGNNTSIDNDNFAYVAGGTFEMGDQFDEGESDEKPVHSVTIDGFYMGKYEVTNEDFAAFLNARGNQKEGGTEWLDIESDYCKIEKSESRYQSKSGYANHPVVKVSWYGARAYAAWRTEVTGKTHRLPTEAEWEYAARGGGKNVRFGNGKDVADPNEMNFDGSEDYKKSYSRVGTYREHTVAVNEFAANGLGLYNISGNVWEWCSDWYDSQYYTNSPSDNPLGPSSGSDRVIRGGSWYDGPYDCRAAFRLNRSSALRTDYVGFRLVVPQL